MCQAEFIRNQFFKEEFFHGWNGRRVAGFGGEAVRLPVFVERK